MIHDDSRRFATIRRLFRVIKDAKIVTDESISMDESNVSRLKIYVFTWDRYFSSRDRDVRLLALIR